MKTFKAAVIGCGGVSGEHIEGYLHHPQTRLVALADIDEERLKSVGQSAGVDHLYTDYRQLLEKERPDLVSICTHARLHHEMVIAAAAQHGHILCEKPMAITLAEADHMIQVCEAEGVHLAINHQQSCSPHMHKAKTLLHEGLIGDLKLIRDRGKARMGGYELIEIGTHLFDAMRFFAGDALTAFAHMTTAGRDTQVSDIIQGPARDVGLIAGDDVISHFTFGSGVRAVAEFFMGLGRDTVSGPRLLIGSKGILAIKNEGSGTSVYHYPRAVYAPSFSEVWSPLEIDDQELSLHGRLWPSRHIVRAIDELVSSIEAERPSLIDAANGRAALEMTVASYTSHFSGSRVSLPLADRRHPLEVLVAEQAAGNRS